MPASSPNSEDGHATRSQEEGEEGEELKLPAAPHSFAEEVSSDEVHQGHVNEDTSRDRVKHALNNQSLGAVFVVGRGDAHSDGNAQWGGDGEEEPHDQGGHVAEPSLGDASSECKPFEELVEGECSEQGSDGARTAGNSNRDANDDRMRNDSKLKHLRYNDMSHVRER